MRNLPLLLLLSFVCGLAFVAGLYFAPLWTLGGFLLISMCITVRAFLTAQPQPHDEEDHS